MLGGVLGVFAPAGGLDPLQQAVFDAVARRLYSLDPDAEVVPIEPGELKASAGEVIRHQVLYVAALLELVAHPLAPAAARAVDRAAAVLDVPLAVVNAARRKAQHHYMLLRADLRRSSWYTHETEKEMEHGRLIELVRSKLAYEGGVPDRTIAKRWTGLRDCPEGSWGLAVAEFYERHNFPFPGERHGIYEIGALHDFVHVLTDYDATPDGEMDVFAFIAAAMPGDTGMILLAVTLGMFQSGTIHRVEGRVVKIACEDALSAPGAVDRFADALARGRECKVDPMAGIDHFALAREQLDDVRARFNVVEKSISEGSKTS